MSSKDLTSRSWFIVLPNPEKHSEVFASLEDKKKICEEVVYRWTETNPDSRSACCLYCRSADDLDHLHMVLENKNGTAFKTLKNWFENLFGCSPHIEATKGNKSQVEDYINKRGKFEEKGEVILERFKIGELVGNQGRRTDLTLLYEMVQNGMTPNQILELNPEAYRFETHLNKMFYNKRKKEIGIVRDVHFHWECGPTGCGKSNVYYEIAKKYGEESIYYVNCESGHIFDNYDGQPFVFLDEFRGGVLRWGELLSLTDKYVTPVAARYSNKYSLWTHIFVSVVNPPDITYSELLFNKGLDNFAQLSRRLESVCYHYYDNDTKEYKEYRITASSYMEQIKTLLQSTKASFPELSQQKNAFLLPDRKAFFEKGSPIPLVI